MTAQPLRYGMVGGGYGSFIGNAQRWAAAVDGKAALVAGCFSSDEARNREFASKFVLADDRIYDDYAEMARAEAARDDGIDFVCIVTPNRLHFDTYRTFLEAGIHVFAEKPLTFTVDEARQLEALAQERGLYMAVNYTYTGYAMVKFARDLVRRGEIGDIININAEYLQDWLLGELGASDTAERLMSIWRTDPAQSGISNCVGDIGSHIEGTVNCITGLEVRRVCAVLDRYGQQLDLNANMLVTFDGGVHGSFACSQVCAGHANGLVVRVFGTKGAIEWAQEYPDDLKVTRLGGPEQLYRRGSGLVDGAGAEVNHLPVGHPEGLTMAIANIMGPFTAAVAKAKAGQPVDEADLDFTDVSAGRRGVEFITAVVASDAAGATWVEL